MLPFLKINSDNFSRRFSDQIDFFIRQQCPDSLNIGTQPERLHNKCIDRNLRSLLNIFFTFSHWRIHQLNCNQPTNK